MLKGNGEAGHWVAGQLESHHLGLLGVALVLVVRPWLARVALVLGRVWWCGMVVCGLGCALRAPWPPPRVREWREAQLHSPSKTLVQAQDRPKLQVSCFFHELLRFFLSLYYLFLLFVHLCHH